MRSYTPSSGSTQYPSTSPGSRFSVQKLPSMNMSSMPAVQNALTASRNPFRSQRRRGVKPNLLFLPVLRDGRQAAMHWWRDRKSESRHLHHVRDNTNVNITAV